MSRIKRMLEEVAERGFLSTGDGVCREHVLDRFLLDQLSDISTPSRCAVCGQTMLRYVGVDELRDIVVAVIEAYRRRAIDELYLDDETGSGYALSDTDIEDTTDVVYALFGEAFDDRLMDYVTRTLDEEQWFDPGVLWLRGADLYLYSWQRFRGVLRSSPVNLSNLLAGELDDPRRTSEPADGIPPSQILPKLWDLIDTLGLVLEVPASNEWVRAIYVPTGEHLSASRLGTAPGACSTENRINRASEPMFYGAADEETALREVGEARTNIQTVIGTWEPSRPLYALDLVDLPSPPHLYDVKNAAARWQLCFLADFAVDVSQPVGTHAPNEYRATQIFMDFLRKSGIDGIVYRSSRTGERCCALDVDNAHCIDRDVPIERVGDLHLILKQWRIES